VPISYDLVELSNVSGNVDLFVLMTYDADSQLDIIDPIADSLASKMGEVRGANGKAMIDVMVTYLPSENATTSELVGSLYDYYTADPAFTGVVMTLESDYSEMVPAPEDGSAQEEGQQNNKTPGFGIVSVVLGFGFVFHLKKRKR
jgi:hypothetical protein